MSEFKGTPGPWLRLEPDLTEYPTKAVGAIYANSRMIATAWAAGAQPAPLHDDEGFYNWHLLAASWEMFDSIDPETLEAIADEIGSEFHNSARADSLRIIARKQRAALAKALGEQP